MINRIFSNFSSLFLCSSLFFGTGYGAVPKPTVQNLNALYLWPVNEVIFKRLCTTIPNLFEKINKKGVPANGTLMVTNNAQHPVWSFQKGLPENLNTPIFIHSGPRDDVLGRLWKNRGGHGVRCTHPWVKNSIINGPLVAFDYFYERDGFDFGQGVNIDCLDLIYNQIKTKNPAAPVVIAATCIGAKITLEFAASRNTDAIKALILESPFIDTKILLRNLEKNYGVSWLPLEVQSVLRWYFADSKKSLHKPHADLSKIRSDMPIFSAHLDNDSYINNKEMKELIDQLRKNGNQNIYLLVIKDGTHHHGHLNYHKTFAQASSAFLARYGLPHNAQLAQEGKELLELARANAQAQSHTDWKTVQSTMK